MRYEQGNGPAPLCWFSQVSADGTPQNNAGGLVIVTDDTIRLEQTSQASLERPGQIQ